MFGAVTLQGYAWEITTKEGGWGMDGVLQSRQHVLNGIANGIDTTEWNPASDKLIPNTYTSSDLAGRLSASTTTSAWQDSL